MDKKYFDSTHRFGRIGALIGIVFMRVFRNAKRKDACMIIETDDPIPPESIRAIQNLKPVIREVCTL